MHVLLRAASLSLSQTPLGWLVFSFFVLYCFHGRRNPLESHNGGTVVEWDRHKATYE